MPTTLDLPGELAAYLGRDGGSLDDAAVTAHLRTVTALARAHTRGNGFDEYGDPTEDIAAVIVSAAARAVGNPTHTELSVVGAITRRPGRFTGWSLPELAVLNGYRRRLA